MLIYIQNTEITEIVAGNHTVLWGTIYPTVKPGREPKELNTTKLYARNPAGNHSMRNHTL